MRLRSIVPFALVALATAGAAASPATAQTWRRPLEAFLDRPPLDRHLWGIAVADSTGRLLWGRNATRLFIPASNTKLIVSAAAAVLLPAEWTVPTSVYGTGPVRDGVLQGHLVLYGRGDPTMGRRCFASDTLQPGVCARDPFEPLRTLARGLRAAGVTRVAGDLVGDGSWFEPELIHPTWEHGDLPWRYAAPVSGLGFHENSLEVVASPGTVGGPAALSVWPDLGDVVLENRTVTSAPGTARTFEVVREPGSPLLIARGDVPADRPPRTEYVTVTDPGRFAAEAFRRVLAEEGIAVAGATGSTTDSLLDRAARATPPLAEVRSRPVRDWIFPVQSSSENWYAEMLFKTLGRQFGTAGSWAEGLAVTRRFLIDSVGVDSTQVRQRDGSGLSTVNLVTPASFVRLLAWMRRHPAYPVFSAGMPVGGETGTLRNRFRGTPLAGRVIAKTGTLTSGNTLSGYLERPGRGTLIFSIQANHHALTSQAMVAAIDSIVTILGRR